VWRHMRARVLLRLLLPCSLLLLLLYAVPAKSEARTKRGGRRRKRVAPPAQQRKKQQDGGTMYGFDPASVPVVPWVAEKLQTEPQRWNVTCARSLQAPDGCYPVKCGRMVIDDFFSAGEVCVCAIQLLPLTAVAAATAYVSACTLPGLAGCGAA
jgi:hypothetical protein